MSPVEDDLIRQAQRLPRTIEPDRDLWPGIEAALLNEGTDSSEPATILPFRSRWNGIGIAAGLLMAAVLGFWLGDTLDQPAPAQIAAMQSTDAGPATAVPVPVLLGVAPDLNQTRFALAETIFSRLSTLPPDSREVIAENLHTINQALDEIDRALSQVPASGLDRHLLMSMYVDQLALLTAMNRLIRSPNQGRNPNQEIVL